MPGGLRDGDTLRSAETSGRRGLPGAPSFRIFEQALTPLNRGWLRLSYSQSFLAQPARPLLRFRREDGPAVEQVLPAAVFGRARWIGAVPEGATAVEMMAYDGAAEHFRIDAVEFIGARALLWRLLTRSPDIFLRHCTRMAFQGGPIVERRLQADLECRPLSEFAAFVAAHRRPIEREGLDRPPAGTADDAPVIEFMMVLPQPFDDTALADTIGSLDGQADPGWILRIAAPAGATIGGRARLDCLDIVEYPLGAPRQTALAALVARATGRMICILEPGDRLMPEAVLALRAAIVEYAPAVLYTDSALADGSGRAVVPLLKPDWSPEFLRQQNYVGGLCLFDATRARHIVPFLPPESGHPGLDLLLALTADLAGAQIRHLRRVLVSRRSVNAPDLPEEIAVPRDRHPAPRPRPRISIIVPTRDRCDLLRRAVSSVLERTAYPDYELLVIDNCSVEPATIRYLAELEQAGQARVISDRGDFSFSRIVNDAVPHASGEVLVLLNNDTYVIAPGWLDELAALASLPDVGAVGAKLLYPDGRLQHAGVVAGLFGSCGHFYRRLPADHVDRLGRLQAVHELSAVTAACLAVRRQVWDRAGGFDESFAVDYNDIDFCLRLRRLGLRNLWTPHAVLGHEESASRGRGRVDRALFLAEARRFAERWRQEIQGDPYFHPALSLIAAREMLE
jgi:GT2 family glycosyltransferase